MKIDFSPSTFSPSIHLRSSVGLLMTVILLENITSFSFDSRWMERSSWLFKYTILLLSAKSLIIDSKLCVLAYFKYSEYFFIFSPFLEKDIFLHLTSSSFGISKSSSKPCEFSALSKAAENPCQIFARSFMSLLISS